MDGAEAVVAVVGVVGVVAFEPREARELVRAVAEAVEGESRDRTTECVRHAVRDGAQCAGDGCAKRARHPREPSRDRGRVPVAVVAAEEFVAAVAREDDLHAFGRHPRDEKRRDLRAVGERFVPMLRDA